MRLIEAQKRFATAVGMLLSHIQSAGYECTLGDAYRDPRVFGMVGDRKGYGRSRSNHKVRLAIDLNLFRDGEYLTDSEQHRPIGEWWEQYGAEQGLPLSWGGHFGDGNHYSMEWNGRR